MPYPADLDRRDRIRGLLGRVWPRLPEGIRKARGWGADWFEVSTPFTSEDAAGNPVGLVGVIEMPLWIGGRDVAVAGIHGVCVDPEHRGRGHLRRAMERALSFVDGRWPAAVLWTDEPGLYHRWGFRAISEPAFAFDLDRARRAPRSRALDLDRSADIERLAASLANRSPVSDISGTREPGWHFLVDLALTPSLHGNVHVLEDIDALVVAEPIEACVRIHDVVAPSMPALDEIVEALGLPCRRVEVLFTPDRLRAPAPVLIPHPEPGPLMVRGDLDVESLGPFALPPLTRC